jgi:hypothetical protein
MTFKCVRKSVGHEPLKFFQQFFDKIKDNEEKLEIDKIHCKFTKRAQNRRYKYEISQMQKYMVGSRFNKSEDETWIDAYIKYLEEHSIINKEETITLLKERKNEKYIQQCVESVISKINSSFKIIFVLLHHAVITTDLEARTRYPDENDNSPYKEFSIDSPLVRCMPYLLYNLAEIITDINNIYNDPDDFKPLSTVSRFG